MAWTPWTPQPKADQGAVLDPTCLNPKLSVRVPDDLHQRVRIYAIQHHTTAQAIVVAALTAYLAQGPAS